MAKVYEALRRAEEERKRKAGGEAAPVAAVDWDSSPQAAPKTKRGWFKRRKRGAKRARPTRGSMEANRRRISLLEPDSFVSEQFRVLRGRIDSIASQRPLRTIAVTSANAGEGKSNVSINLAVVMAMGVGSRVLLVDCDLRRPMIHRSLGLEPQMGLAEVLMGQVTLDQAVLKLEEVDLDVLAVRGLPENPSELLGSSQMRSLIEEASRRYDRTILDTPATLGLPDAKILSEIVDGAVIVVRAGETPREEVQACLDILDRRRILGMVLNGAEQGHERYGYGYY
jgi:capsular exopolysaccharide synthesis family protein